MHQQASMYNDSSGDEAGLERTSDSGGSPARGERASLIPDAENGDSADGQDGGAGGGGGGGEVSGGEVKKKAESKKSRRSWHPLSEADARRIDLFETAISAQTVIVVLLYVSFGTAGYSLFGR
jgi:hypothetical protein